MKAVCQTQNTRGFTFIEALMTLAILSVLTSVIIGAFSNASADTNRIVARQQQAAVQSAVNAWVNSDSNRVDVINATTGTAKMRTLSEIITAYNSASTDLARLTLISSYLDTNTVTDFFNGTTISTQIQSRSLISAKQYLSLPTWVSTSYPQVLLNSL